MNTFRISNRLALLGALAVLSVAAQADVKVVSKLTMNMMGGAQPPRTVTTYYKGNLIRTENDGSIVILNTANHQVTSLNPTAKTYSVSSMGMGNKAGKMPEGLKVSSSAHTTPTNQTKTIAGKTAKLYKFSGTMNMSSTQPGQAGNGSLKMNIDVWTASGVKTSMSASQMMGQLTQAFQNMGPLGSGMKNMMGELAKIKGFPLDSNATITFSGGQPGGQPMTFTMTFSNTVQSLNETSLSPSLFQVPAGYKKVAAPTGMGRMGRGMGH